MTLVDGIIATSVLLAPAIVLTAMGGLLHQRSGVVNIALEGLILAGALVGLVVADATGSTLGGVAAAVSVGAVLGWAYSAVITRLGGSMIIVGLGFNFLVLGAAGLFLVQTFGSRSSFRPSERLFLPALGLDFLAGVPVLGPLLARNDVIVWLTIPIVALVAFILDRTTWGLRLRAVGADPVASTNLGLNVRGLQDSAGAAAGALAALGGAHLAVGATGLFSTGMSAGRGYIALTAIYFGRTRPWVTTVACLVYVVADAVQGRLQLQLPWIPVRLVQVLPYVAVIVVLILAQLTSKRRRIA